MYLKGFSPRVLLQLQNPRLIFLFLYTSTRVTPKPQVSSQSSKNMLLASVLLFAVGAASWTIPKGQAEGVYRVHVDGSGIEKHYNPNDHTLPTRDLVASAKFADARAANRRQIGGCTNEISCGGYEINHDNTDGAVHALDTQCGGGGDVGGNLDFYSIAGAWYAISAIITPVAMSVPQRSEVRLLMLSPIVAVPTGLGGMYSVQNSVTTSMGRGISAMRGATSAPEPEHCRYRSVEG